MPVILRPLQLESALLLLFLYECPQLGRGVQQFLPLLLCGGEKYVAFAAEAADFLRRLVRETPHNKTGASVIGRAGKP